MHSNVLSRGAHGADGLRANFRVAPLLSNEFPALCNLDGRDGPLSRGRHGMSAGAQRVAF